jgi:hypothetical protein
MDEFVKLITSKGAKIFGISATILIGAYVGVTIFKNYVEVHKNILQAKVASLQILEFKAKYAGIMADKGANTNIRVKEGTKISEE